MHTHIYIYVYIRRCTETFHDVHGSVNVKMLNYISVQQMKNFCFYETFVIQNKLHLNKQKA